jgi:predicted Fe-S protein YdhL (DUF1289 family)
MTNQIKSPCIGVCEYAKITEGELERTCKGCSRTAEEIEEWFLATEERRKQIIKASAARKLEEEYKKDLTSLKRIFKIVS